MESQLTRVCSLCWPRADTGHLERGLTRVHILLLVLSDTLPLIQNGSRDYSYFWKVIHKSLKDIKVGNCKNADQEREVAISLSLHLWCSLLYILDQSTLNTSIQINPVTHTALECSSLYSQELCSICVLVLDNSLKQIKMFYLNNIGQLSQFFLAVRPIRSPSTL